MRSNFAFSCDAGCCFILFRAFATVRFIGKIRSTTSGSKTDFRPVLTFCAASEFKRVGAI